MTSNENESTMMTSNNNSNPACGSTTQLNPTKFQIRVEKFRLIAYISFWFICFFAMLVTSIAVAPNLGPCPKTEGAEPTYGLHCSVLVEKFGFNNICVNWDYSPAREVTALVYPLFEYTLLIYIVFSYLQIKNDFDNNKVGGHMMTLLSSLLWVKIVLVAWFRMIFVCTVTQDPIPLFGTEIPEVLGHTLGFFGMQFALILIAFENAVYAFYTDQRVFGLSTNMTKKAVLLYLACLLITTCLKVSWALSIFATGSPWFGAPWPHIIDRMWMVLAAVLPLFFSINGMRTEPDMEIIIVNKPRVDAAKMSIDTSIMGNEALPSMEENHDEECLIDEKNHQQNVKPAFPVSPF